ncbi:MAG: class I SAM-dependent methyltransferase [Planctomycetales bacterium]|nr:class I SAM-dependent methyltransferase [Planctomycetales bacterium]
MGFTIPPVHKYLPLILRQSFGPQRLERIPEPRAITDQPDNVLQYDQVMTTKLAIAYAVCLETIYRARPEPFGGAAIDVACGPGHFSLLMAKELKLDRLVGVDLSEPMLEVAAKNAREQGRENVEFRQADATSLRAFGDNQFDLATFTDAAHHLPDLSAVTRVLEELERVTKPTGLICVMDLARLRTAEITQSYVNLVGQDYHAQGLGDFYQDFSNSMFAAWTCAQLAETVPANTRRHWYHLRPLGLPTIQFLLGVPAQAWRLRPRAAAQELSSHRLAASAAAELQLLQASLRIAKPLRIKGSA